jgi:hypothetical protein
MTTPSPPLKPVSPELRRLAASREPPRPWKLWGPYLAERQWGTVREDYSADGDVWRTFPHDHARGRAQSRIAIPLAIQAPCASWGTATWHTKLLPLAIQAPCA